MSAGADMTRYAVVLLAGLAIGSVGAWKAQEWRHGIIAAEAEQLRARDDLRAFEAAQAVNMKLQERADRAERKQTQRDIENRRAAVAAQSELDRLRSAVASSGDNSSEAGAGGADTARELLGACAAELVELGRAADGHASDALRLWEAWPAD